MSQTLKAAIQKPANASKLVYASSELCTGITAAIGEDNVDLSCNRGRSVEFFFFQSISVRLGAYRHMQHFFISY